MLTSTSLARLSNRLRLDALQMIHDAASGHTGGSLSCIDIITALYCGGFLKHDPKKLNDPTRDFFFLSKAHASPAIYAVLAERGFFPKKELLSFRQVNSLLQGHPNQHVPGVEVAGGSLGQGLSIAAGTAMGLQAAGKKNRVFCLMGDGELQEGQIWEAAMTAAHYKLGNLTAFVDNNTLQIDGANDEVMTVTPIAKKFKSFGWDVMTIDGHDMTQIVEALERAAQTRTVPLLILAKTVKGKGAPMAEGNYAYHGTPLNADEMKIAKEHLASKC